MSFVTNADGLQYTQFVYMTNEDPLNSTNTALLEDMVALSIIKGRTAEDMVDQTYLTDVSGTGFSTAFYDPANALDYNGARVTSGEFSNHVQVNNGVFNMPSFAMINRYVYAAATVNNGGNSLLTIGINTIGGSSNTIEKDLYIDINSNPYYEAVLHIDISSNLGPFWSDSHYNSSSDADSYWIANFDKTNPEWNLSKAVNSWLNNSDNVEGVNSNYSLKVVETTDFNTNYALAKDSQVNYYTQTDTSQPPQVHNLSSSNNMYTNGLALNTGYDIDFESHEDYFTTWKLVQQEPTVEVWWDASNNANYGPGQEGDLANSIFKTLSTQSDQNSALATLPSSWTYDDFKTTLFSQVTNFDQVNEDWYFYIGTQRGNGGYYISNTEGSTSNDVFSLDNDTLIENNDYMRLAYPFYAHKIDISNGSVTITDTTPDVNVNLSLVNHITSTDGETISDPAFVDTDGFINLVIAAPNKRSDILSTYDTFGNAGTYPNSVDVLYDASDISLTSHDAGFYSFEYITDPSYNGINLRTYPNNLEYTALCILKNHQFDYTTEPHPEGLFQDNSQSTLSESNSQFAAYILSPNSDQQFTYSDISAGFVPPSPLDFRMIKIVIDNKIADNEPLRVSDVLDVSFNASVTLGSAITSNYLNSNFRVRLENRTLTPAQPSTLSLAPTNDWSLSMGADGTDQYLIASNYSNSLPSSADCNALILDSESTQDLTIVYSTDVLDGNQTSDKVVVTSGSNSVSLFESAGQITITDITSNTTVTDIFGSNLTSGLAASGFIDLQGVTGLGSVSLANNSYINDINSIVLRRTETVSTFTSKFKLPLKPYSNIYMTTDTLTCTDVYYQVFKRTTDLSPLIPVNNYVLNYIKTSTNEKPFIPSAKEFLEGNTTSTITLTGDMLKSLYAVFQQKNVDAGGGWNDNWNNITSTGTVHLVDPFFNTETVMTPPTLGDATVTLSPDPFLVQPTLPDQYYYITLNQDFEQNISVISRGFGTGDNTYSDVYVFNTNENTNGWVPSSGVPEEAGTNLGYSAALSFEYSGTVVTNNILTISDSDGNVLFKISSPNVMLSDFLIYQNIHDWFNINYNDTWFDGDWSFQYYWPNGVDYDGNEVVGEPGVLSIDAGIVLKDSDSTHLAELVSISVKSDQIQVQNIAASSGYTLSPSTNPFVTTDYINNHLPGGFIMDNLIPVSTDINLMDLGIEWIRGYHYYSANTDASGVDTQLFTIERIGATARMVVTGDNDNTDYADYGKIYTGYNTGGTAFYNLDSDIGLEVTFQWSILPDGWDISYPLDVQGDYVQIYYYDPADPSGAYVNEQSYSTDLRYYNLFSLNNGSYNFMSRKIRTSVAPGATENGTWQYYEIDYIVNNLDVYQGEQDDYLGDPTTKTYSASAVQSFTIGQLRDGVQLFDTSIPSSYMLTRTSRNSEPSTSYIVVARPFVAFSMLGNNAVSDLPFADNDIDTDYYYTQYVAINNQYNSYNPFSSFQGPNNIVNNITFYMEDSHTHYLSNGSSDGTPVARTYNDYYHDEIIANLNIYVNTNWIHIYESINGSNTDIYPSVGDNTNYSIIRNHYNNIFNPYPDDQHPNAAPRWGLIQDMIDYFEGWGVSKASENYVLKYLQSQVGGSPSVRPDGNITLNIGNGFLPPGSNIRTMSSAQGNGVEFLGVQPFVDTSGSSYSFSFKIYKYNTGRTDYTTILNDVGVDNTTPFELQFLSTIYSEKTVTLPSITIDGTPLSYQAQLNRLTLADIQDATWSEEVFAEKVNFSFVPLTSVRGYQVLKSLFAYPESKTADDGTEYDHHNLVCNYFTLPDLITMKNRIGFPIFRISYNGSVMSSSCTTNSLVLNSARPFNIDSAGEARPDTAIFSEYNVDSFNPALTS